MPNLNDYLDHKRAALADRDTGIEAVTVAAATLSAAVRVAGRSGVREIRIRDHAVLTDSPPDFAGYNLGPSSPELQLGVLGSCVAHILLIHAAYLQVPLESVEVRVRGQIDPRAGRPGFETVPVWPHDIGYTVTVDSSASDDQLRQLFETVEARCPILNLLKHPQPIAAELRRSNGEPVHTS